MNVIIFILVKKKKKNIKLNEYENKSEVDFEKESFLRSELSQKKQQQRMYANYAGYAGQI